MSLDRISILAPRRLDSLQLPDRGLYTYHQREPMPMNQQGGAQGILAAACPDNIAELAAQYYFGRLPQAEAEALEHHALRCPKCAQTVMEVFAFIDAFRMAAKHLGRASALEV